MYVNKLLPDNASCRSGRRRRVSVDETSDQARSSKQAKTRRRKNLTQVKKSDTSGLVRFPQEKGLFWLLELPNELLLQILNLLTATDVLSLSRLSQRVLDLSCTLKKAHFLRKSKVLSQGVEDYFSHSRPNSITQINFDYLYTANPEVLCKVIKKCRHLNRLSIFECGIHFDMIRSILDTCEQLEELTWGLNTKSIAVFSEGHPRIALNSLKKLTLFVPYSVDPDWLVMAYFVYVCRSLRNIYMNCTDDFTVLPYCASSMNLFRFPTPIVDQQLIYPSYSSIEEGSRKGSEIFERLLYAHEHYKFFTEATPDCDFRESFELEECKEGENIIQVFNEAGFLQLTSSLTDLSVLPSRPANSVEKLVFIWEDDISEMTGDVIPAIIKVGGDKLRYLTIQDTTLEYDETPSSYDSKSVFLTYGLKEILFACRFITALNIAEFHYDSLFPFEAFRHVEGLDTLTLSSCALVGHQERVWVNEIDKMVANSKKIKHFTMFGCSFCNNGPNEFDMVSLKEWENLQHLTLMHIPTLHKCLFLQAVANLCTGLKRLEMVQIGPADECYYTEQVSYVLKKAKNLNFLRLNQKGFHPGDTYFWKCISQAKKLEGLCILNASLAMIDFDLVINALQKLKCLSLFHYSSQTYLHSLRKFVQSSMEKHGIENPRVEVRLLQSPRPYMVFQNTVFPGCRYFHFPNV